MEVLLDLAALLQATGRLGPAAERLREALDEAGDGLGATLRSRLGRALAAAGRPEARPVLEAAIRDAAEEGLGGIRRGTEEARWTAAPPPPTA